MKYKNFTINRVGDSNMSNKKRTIYIILLLTAVLNSIIFFRFIMYPMFQEQIISEDLVKLTGEINVNNTVSEIFIAQDNYINKIEIFFSTYDRVNDGVTEVSILEGEDIIYRDVIHNNEVLDNSYKVINTENISTKKGEEYQIRISSLEDKNGISAWKDNEGKLVAKVIYEKKLELINIFQINIVFLGINTFLIKLIKYLKN